MVVKVYLSQFITNLSFTEAFKRHHARMLRFLLFFMRSRRHDTRAGLDSGKNFLCAFYHLARHAGKLRHLDAIAIIRRTLYNLPKEGDPVPLFFGSNVIVDDSSRSSASVVSSW